MAGTYDRCAKCGVQLNHAPGRGKARKYCSTSCQDAAAVLRWAAKPMARSPVEACTRDATRSGGTLCDMHYYRIRRNGSVRRQDGIPDGIKACVYCSSPLGAGIIYCSDRCSWRSKRGLPQTISCAVCCCVFSPFERNLVCSDACNEERARQQARAWRQANITLQRARARVGEYKRKARKAAVAYEDIDRAALFERDGWRCRLCGVPVDREAKWPAPGFATLDHIVPLAKGGSHTAANLQTAHLKCNVSKGARDKPMNTYKGGALSINVGQG